MQKLSYFPTTWASNISVHLHREQLLMTGQVSLEDSQVEPERDAYLQYVSSVNWKFGEKRTGGKSPHIRFANADSDAKLIAFVREFGPVAASLVEIQEPEPDRPNMTLEDLQKKDWRSAIGALEDLPALRRERSIYAAALKLVIELRKGEDRASITTIRQHVSEIVEGVWYWPDQWEREKKWLTENFCGDPAWHFDASHRSAFSTWQSYTNRQGTSPFGPPRPYHAAHSVLCELINTFRTEVDHVGDTPVEALPFGSLRFGVRPILYLILRHEYLWRGGAVVCSNDRCGRFFVRERAGARFCDEVCSRQYRQREYWAKTGVKKRKRRRAKQRSRARKTLRQ